MDHDKVMHLTAREMWDYYIRPGIERAKAMEHARRGEKVMPEMSDEAICGFLEMLGVLSREEEVSSNGA